METDRKGSSTANDLVLNGIELGGGSIRIHKQEVQKRLFSSIGLKEEDVWDKFSFL